MKSEKGITLTSLIIYVIVMLIIVTIIGTITTSVSKDAEEAENYSKNVAEYNNFNLYFLKDVKEVNAKIKSISDDKHIITFENGNKYTFDVEQGNIYFNTIVICSRVEECIFDIKTEDGEKQVVIVNMKLSNEFEKHTEYVLVKDNWNTVYVQEDNYIL